MKQELGGSDPVSLGPRAALSIDLRTGTSLPITQPGACRAARLGIRFGVILGLIAFAFAGTRAEAARLYGYWLSTHEAGHGHRKQAAPPSIAPSIRTPVPKQPLQIVISIADQSISVYSADALIARSVVSTGVREHPTPMGVFTVIQKQRLYRVV